MGRLATWLSRTGVPIVIAAALAAIPAAYGQHPAINLLDRNGDIIDPVSGDNANAAFSTRQTCGLCHDYDEITKGFHFQAGWDVISDDFGREQGRPWVLSNGFLGRWYPYAFRQLAHKQNESPDEIDLTVYDFVGFSSPGRGEPPCGACHAGGGGLETDRDGERYDERLAEHPELAETFDGDYYQSKWDKSGVVEADCLICHLEGYDFGGRIEQLEQGNYRWAVVAGSRFGVVEGSVRRGREPEVRYHPRLFNEDGTLPIDMSWPPPDDNCMNCHGRSDRKKRGFSWNDIHNADLHNEQRVSCTACHPAGSDHQIARGEAGVAQVAPELHGTMLGCKGCHLSGTIGAPMPEHQTIRPSHVQRIACKSCHIPELHRAAARGMDATTGELQFYLDPPKAERVGDLGTWAPIHVRRENGMLYPVNSVLTVWWGNRDADGLIYPLFLREHEAGWRKFADQVEDDDGDGRKEVNRDDEIVAGLKAFQETLAGNRRFESISPVLIKAETAWELDDSGNLTSSPLAGTPLEGASSVEFPIAHNVAPTSMTLGVNGCEDCHVSQANFFSVERETDLFGPEGKPVGKGNGFFWGCSPLAFTINSIHQRIISPYIGPFIIVVVFLIVVHYHSYGPKRITFDPYSQEIQRFSLLERGVHLFRLLAFVVLGVSGLIMAFNLHLWQQLLFESPQRLLDLHIGSGIVFIVTTIIGIGLWFRDAKFANYDKDWVKKGGGYLGAKGRVPAGRFNAGQKMFYWYTAIFGAVISVTGVMLIFKYSFQLSTMCLTSTIHNLIGFFLIAGVLAHAYLGTVANPGTWRVLVDGSVTREWAEHHHPNWYDALVKAGVVRPRKDEEGHRGDGKHDA